MAFKLGRGDLFSGSASHRSRGIVLREQQLSRDCHCGELNSAVQWLWSTIAGHAAHWGQPVFCCDQCHKNRCRATLAMYSTGAIVLTPKKPMSQILSTATSDSALVYTCWGDWVLKIAFFLCRCGQREGFLLPGKSTRCKVVEVVGCAGEIMHCKAACVCVYLDGVSAIMHFPTRTTLAPCPSN